MAARHTSGRRGQAVIETATFLLAFVALMSSVIEFGRLYMAWVALQNGVREGARYGVTGRTAAGHDRAASIKDVVVRRAG